MITLLGHASSPLPILPPQWTVTQLAKKVRKDHNATYRTLPAYAVDGALSYGRVSSAAAWACVYRRLPS